MILLENTLYLWECRGNRVPEERMDFGCELSLTKGWTSRFCQSFSRTMSPATSFCLLAVVAQMCEVGVAAEGPVPRHTEARQQGDAVIFFAAHQGSLKNLQYDPIPFNQVLVNQGLGFDNRTGVFRAPVSGIYQFVFAAQLCRGDHNNMWYFKVNGARQMLCHAQVADSDTTLNSCFYLAELVRGDRVWVFQRPDSCAWASSTSKTITFSGVLLAREGASMLGAKYGNSCPLQNFIRSPPSGSQEGGPTGLVLALTLVLLLSGEP